MNTDWLKAQAGSRPQALALLFGNQTWTYRELDAWVDEWCGRVASLGLTVGDRLGLCLPNTPETVALVHAAARLGLILVPLNTRLTERELAWQVEQTGCKAVISEQWTVNSEQLAVSSEQLAVNSEQLAVSSEQSPVSGLHSPHSPFTIHHSPFTINQLWSLPPIPFSPAPFSLDNLQAIVFTSGTTGQPKGAMLTFGNHFWSAAASAFRLGVLPDDRWLTCLPLYHVGGQAILFRSALYGTAVVLQQGFDPERINAILDNDQITLVSLVPTMLHRLLETRTHWPESLRLILLGGAAAEPSLIHRANALERVGEWASGRVNTRNSELGTRNSALVAPTYGLSEAASQIATLLPAEAQAKPGSVGKPLLFTTVRIADEQGQTLPSGEIGEVVIKGPTVMQGYWQNPEATAQTIRDGELFTGDLGYLDGDGDLWLVQRRSDLIVTGGENVYPAEVENVLKQHPAVAAACVVGIPDPQWGQQVAALIVLRSGPSPTPEQLVTFARQYLAGYKIPRHIQFTDSLPQTASGKIERHAIQRQLQPVSPGA